MPMDTFLLGHVYPSRESERSGPDLVKDAQIVLSHETDTDTLDRSTIRLAFQENIEFPGFRWSNQFVAIRAAPRSSLLWTSFRWNNRPRLLAPRGKNTLQYLPGSQSCILIRVENVARSPLLASLPPAKYQLCEGIGIRGLIGKIFIY